MTIFQNYRNDMIDRRFEQGNEYSVNYHGERHTIVIVHDYGNGSLEVLVDGEEHAMSKEQLKGWLTNTFSTGEYAVHVGKIDLDKHDR